jgi:hypothetical protein
VAVDRSARLPDRATARKVLRQIRDEIERGMFAPIGAPNFCAATIEYLNAGGSNRFLVPLVKHFEETPLSAIDQRAIDQAAAAIYPNASPATRNRQVYTPMAPSCAMPASASSFAGPRGTRDGQNRVA